LSSQLQSTARRAAAIALAAACAVACSKINAENYAQLKAGMSYAEVTAILGSPASCDDTAGFKACKWGDAKSGISVRFVADKVVLHSAQNIR